MQGVLCQQPTCEAVPELPDASQQRCEFSWHWVGLRAPGMKARPPEELGTRPPPPVAPLSALPRARGCRPRELQASSTLFKSSHFCGPL